jgi:hypothetical protein
VLRLWTPRITTACPSSWAAIRRRKLAEEEEDAIDALFSMADVAKTKEERAQYRRDRRTWRDRLESLAAERDRELELIDARYREPEPHRFPVAVVFVVPAREVTR